MRDLEILKKYGIEKYQEYKLYVGEGSISFSLAFYGMILTIVLLHLMVYVWHTSGFMDFGAINFSKLFELDLTVLKVILWVIAFDMTMNIFHNVKYVYRRKKWLKEVVKDSNKESR